MLINDTLDISNRDIEIIHSRTADLFKQDEHCISELTHIATKGIHSIHSCRHKKDEMHELILRNNIQMLINIGTPRRISHSLINEVATGIVNIHPGYLPAYRGSSAVEWSIFENFPLVNTVHYMDENYDSGKIIAHYKVPTSNCSNYYKLRQNVHINSFELCSRVITKFINNQQKKFKSTSQDSNMAKTRQPISPDTLAEVIDIVRYNKYKPEPLSINYPNFLD